jgi:hypothetical protein
MVRKVGIVSTVIVVIFFAGFAIAQHFYSASEPDGFREILWGTDLSKLAGMQFVTSRDIGGSFPESVWDFERGALKKQIKVDIYKKLEDDTPLYGAVVETIRYGFWKGKFCEVTVIVRGQDNVKTFNDGVFDRFGKGTTAVLPSVKLGDEQPDWHYWMGRISEMELIHVPMSQLSKYWIGSTLVRDQAFKEASE